jgi:hypothetical protein
VVPAAGLSLPRFWHKLKIAGMPRRRGALAGR